MELLDQISWIHHEAERSFTTTLSDPRARRGIITRHTPPKNTPVLVSIVCDFPAPVLTIRRTYTTTPDIVIDKTGYCPNLDLIWVHGPHIQQRCNNALRPICGTSAERSEVTMGVIGAVGGDMVGCHSG
eukprot:scaffold52081_cov78-Attheya_sp.AAC.1